MIRILLLIASTILGSGSAIPNGEFDGRHAPGGMRDVVVVFVDGILVFDTSRPPRIVGANPVQELEPGSHSLQVRVVQPGSGSHDHSPLREVKLEVAPCMRYRFAAKPTEDAWEIVATGQATISGCKAPGK
jgi:hypothetical protein